MDETLKNHVVIRPRGEIRMQKKSAVLFNIVLNPFAIKIHFLS